MPLLAKSSIQPSQAGEMSTSEVTPLSSSSQYANSALAARASSSGAENACERSKSPVMCMLRTPCSSRTPR
jgi:hypothetical protein